jgi:hypothetical protein
VSTCFEFIFSIICCICYMVLANSFLNHSSSFQYVIPLNFRGSLSFKTFCYGTNLYQVVIITTMLLATFYVDVFFFLS